METCKCFSLIIFHLIILYVIIRIHNNIRYNCLTNIILSVLGISFALWMFGLCVVTPCIVKNSKFSVYISFYYMNIRYFYLSKFSLPMSLYSKVALNIITYKLSASFLKILSLLYILFFLLFIFPYRYRNMFTISFWIL